MAGLMCNSMGSSFRPMRQETSKRSAKILLMRSLLPYAGVHCRPAKTTLPPFLAYCTSLAARSACSGSEMVGSRRTMVLMFGRVRR